MAVASSWPRCRGKRGWLPEMSFAPPREHDCANDKTVGLPRRTANSSVPGGSFGDLQWDLDGGAPRRRCFCHSQAGCSRQRRIEVKRSRRFRRLVAPSPSPRGQCEALGPRSDAALDFFGFGCRVSLRVRFLSGCPRPRSRAGGPQRRGGAFSWPTVMPPGSTPLGKRRLSTPADAALRRRTTVGTWCSPRGSAQPVEARPGAAKLHDRALRGTTGL